MTTQSDFEQGTPMFRFYGIARWAEERLGHSGFSARGFESTIFESFDKLEEEIKQLYKINQILIDELDAAHKDLEAATQMVGQYEAEFEAQKHTAPPVPPGPEPHPRF